jgi:hypothetical protein
MPQLKTKIEERIMELLPELAIPCDCPKGGRDGSEAERVCQKCNGNEWVCGELHLETILIAIEKVGKYSFDIGLCENNLSITANSKKDGQEECYGYLDLSQPFSNQSQELYLFLLDILTNH